MIPPIQLLSRESLRSGVFGAEYSPFRLLLSISEIPKRNPDNDINFIKDSIKFDAQYSHESLHWLQHHGTTVGAFLSLIRYSQEGTTISWFRDELPSEKRVQILERRLTGKKSIIEFSEGGQLLNSSFNGGKKFELFRQIWHDHQLIHSMLEFSLYQDNISFPRGQVLGEVAADAILYFCNSCGLNYLGNEITRGFYNVDDDSVHFVQAMGQRLTTRSIMEGWATLNDLMALAGWIGYSKPISKDASNLWEEYIRSVFSDGTYRLPLEIFLQVVRPNFKNIIQIIPTINAICYIALNPPLPPLVMQPPSKSESWSWKEIYPPLRFMQLVQAIPKFGLLPLQADHEILESFIYEICDYLDWKSPLEYDHPYPSSPRYMNFSDIEPQENLHFAEDPTLQYYDYILWVQSKMWEYSKQALPYFLNNSESRQGNLSKMYVEAHLGLDNFERWIRPPLILLPNDTLGYGMTSTRFGNWLLLSSCIHYLLFDIMIGEGDLNLSRYPVDFRESITVQNSINNSLKKTFMIDFDFL